MERAHALEVAPQRLLGDAREGSRAVPVSLALAHHELAALEVDVLDAHPQRLEEAEAAAVEEGRDEARGRLHAREERAHLVAREHDGKPARALCAHGGAEPLELALEDGPVEEEMRGERLVLRRGGDAALDGEVREEGHDLERAHLVGMALSVEEDEAADPVDVGVLGAARQVAQARALAHAVEEAGRRGEGRRQRVAPRDRGRRTS